jgi:tRNA1Val (adenine37-N6)-methyltransferase
MNPSSPPTTCDRFHYGALILHQPKHGYRFSIDAVLLATLAEPQSGGLAVDIGTGCGVVALLMARRCPALQILGIELQPELAELARRNVAENRLEARVEIIQGDINDLSARDLPRPADLIVANPPFYRLDSGRLNPHDQKAVARHELRLNLEQLLSAVKRLLRTGGRLVCIYACERLTDLLSGMRRVGIEPKTLRMIHGSVGDEAKLCIVEATQRGRPGMKIHPPLVIYGPDGHYSEEVQGYLTV